MSVTEDLISDAAYIYADARESITRCRELSARAQEISQRSRELIERSQRERRLRNTKLRIVRTDALVSRS
jgi:hypothetical protein